jgi:hypothetical protein
MTTRQGWQNGQETDMSGLVKKLDKIYLKKRSTENQFPSIKQVG